MKPLLLTALFLALTSTGTQASVINPRAHIDDGIFVGPKERTAKFPSVLEQLQRNAASRSSGNQVSLDFSVRGGIARGPRVPPTPTLTESLRTIRSSKRHPLFQFDSTAEVQPRRVSRALTISIPILPRSSFLRRVYSGVPSPFPAFALRSKDSPMSSTRLQRLLSLAANVRVSSLSAH